MQKSNKKLGVGIAVVVVALVVFVTAFFGKNNSSTVATDTSTSTSTNTNPQTDTMNSSTSAATTTDTNSDNQSSTQNSTTPVDTTKKSVATSVYKDGTYTATGSYMSPGGEDQIGVTLTVKNDIVTAATVTPMPGDNMSSRFQQMFVSGYKTYVIGKNLSTLNVGKVSRSSLTPKGFNDAVAQIRTQAQA